MILKIARYGEDSCRHNARWQFIGDVAELSTQPVWLRAVKQEQNGDDGEKRETTVLRCFMREDGGEEYGPDVYSVPHNVGERVLKGEVKAFRLAGLFLMLRNGSGKTVVCLEAYLMNDDGKTIEGL